MCVSLWVWCVVCVRVCMCVSRGGRWSSKCATHIHTLAPACSTPLPFQLEAHGALVVQLKQELARQAQLNAAQCKAWSEQNEVGTGVCVSRLRSAGPALPTAAEAYTRFDRSKAQPSPLTSAFVHTNLPASLSLAVHGCATARQ